MKLIEASRTELREEAFFFGTDVSATAHPFLCSTIAEYFWTGFCLHRSTITLSPGKDLCFRIGAAPQPTLEAEDEYAVLITPEGVCISAKNQAGLFHGYLTMLDRIETKDVAKGIFSLNCAEIHNAPKAAYRMIHLCVFPETTLESLQKYIRFCGALRFTHITVEFWGMYKYECTDFLHWKDRAYTKEQILPLFEEARQMGMEIIPMFNHLGHASQCRIISGKHVTLDQHPECAPFFERDGWAWDITNPETLKLLRQVRKEQIELCGNCKFFNLGCDEVHGYTTSSEKIAALVEYVNGIAEELLREGIKPIIWGDMLFKRGAFPADNGHYSLSLISDELSEQILSGLDKRIIIADWQYDLTKGSMLTALELKKRGFEVLTCPWFNPKNIQTDIRTAVEHGLLGSICTTWHTINQGLPFLLLGAKELWEGATDISSSLIRAEAATLLRKVAPQPKTYEDCGWSMRQVIPMLP
ncbi:MAG: family 20 glycosylhydrolase [Clostridia bacterium]|nr:family 20 glycosylhydrolase [Clostridia bacterium]